MLAVRGWVGLVDALTLAWLEDEHPLPQARVCDLLAEMFVALLTAAGAVAARDADD